MRKAERVFCLLDQAHPVQDAGVLRTGGNEVNAGGLNGTMTQHVRQLYYVPAYPVKAIDTTAAGDCFTAAFALALSQNKNWKEAIEFGQKASSIAVTRKGAQTSIPTREEVDEMKGGKM